MAYSLEVVSRARARLAQAKEDRESENRQHLAAAYADHLLAEIQPTDQEVRDYFRQHRGEYEEDDGFDPEDESQWLEQVREDLRNETYQNRFREICSQYPFQVNYSAAVLVPPEGLYE